MQVFWWGVLVGLTGIGGCFNDPILLLVFGVAPMTAIGADLWFAAITKMAAGKFLNKRGLIDWQALRYLWMGSLPASVIMVLLMNKGYISADIHMLKNALGIAILITAISMIFQKYIYQIGKHIRVMKLRNLSDCSLY